VPFCDTLRAESNGVTPVDDVTLARALHVFGVVLWIGGVAFVTTVLLPAVKRLKEPGERVAFFEQIERAFAWQARGTTLLVGLTGLHMIHSWDLWHRFAMAEFWWMHAMAAVWVVFTAMLFFAEPLFLHRWFLRQAERHPERTFALVQRLHWLLLILSLITVIGAVLGSHGF
jgi:uncharacterized membrane protein